ncbi:type IV toxin-antitoxin system AbiEi family antitoxin domain-containing protein [Streptomyces sp. NPDC102402]|uniref:type IV toxin-antitoxin system AbiEi family antitoxin domain-containing protein n=1 Tax=Streptomyces sp. NPDC102402 TaxID=3366169 RepID=UPI00381EAC2B
MNRIARWAAPDPRETRPRRRDREMRELAALASGGILLTSAAMAAGWPPRLLNRRLRKGGWQRVHQGAWAAPDRLVDWLTHAWVAQKLQPHLVCSHRTAAALHLVELLGRPRAEAEFTDPRPGVYQRPGVRVHHMALDPADRAVRRGLRTTAPARTVGDLMRCLPRDEAVAAADSALSTRTVHGVRRPALLDTAALRTELATRRAGAARARTWLPLLDPRSGSPAESVARLRLHDAGLFPVTQATLRTASGRALRPDFFFPGQGLVVEVEGYAFHGTREAHTSDLHRFNDLQSCPEVRRVLRFTAAEVFHHPDRFVAEVRAALTELGN